MFYIPLFMLLLMVLLNVVFRFASLFRLTIPVLYAVIVPVFFPDWLHQNETLVMVIWFALIGLVIISWVVTIRKRIRLRHAQTDSVES
jgi:RsiW-degrading membrane proteinase PrsW (M82 family)